MQREREREGGQEGIREKKRRGSHPHKKHGVHDTPAGLGTSRDHDITKNKGEKG
jgi:hypothetical protein